MVTRAREVYRLLQELAPEVLPDPSDVSSWKAYGTDTGFVIVEAEYFEELAPPSKRTVRHYI